MKEITDDDDEEDMQLQESIDKRAKKKNDSHLRYVMKHELVSHKSYIKEDERCKSPSFLP